MSLLFTIWASFVMYVQYQITYLMRYPSYNILNTIMKSETSLSGPKSMSEIYYNNMLLNHLWTADNLNTKN